MKIYKKNLLNFSLKAEKTDFKCVKISCSNDSAEYIRQFFGDDLLIFESFFMVMLNRSLNTIAYVKISQGGICGTVVDSRIISKYAVDCLCSNVILCHNHPNGNIKPSDDDIKITKKVNECLRVFDINLIDHIILTEENYFSFADEGLL